MTVSTEISSNEYTGNGVTTDFDYKFRIFKANQLSVITSDADGDNVVTLRLGTDYTVTGANKSAGGKVILTRPLANGHKISIARDIPITQETSFRNQSKFFAETHEDAFDYLTMIIQRIWGSLGSLYLKRPNILANWFDAKGYRIANLGKPKRDSDAVDLGTLKDEISGVHSTILKKEKRTLRVDDMDVLAFPKASERKNKQVGFDSTGNPTLLDPAGIGVLGYAPVDSFEKGATLTSRYQVLFWEEKRAYFRWDGKLPKIVPPNSTPNETGGIKSEDNPLGLWVDIGDASVRGELYAYRFISFKDVDSMILCTAKGLQLTLTAGDRCTTGSTNWEISSSESGIALSNGLFAIPTSNICLNDFGFTKDIDCSKDIERICKMASEFHITRVFSTDNATYLHEDTIDLTGVSGVTLDYGKAIVIDNVQGISTVLSHRAKPTYIIYDSAGTTVERISHFTAPTRTTSGGADPIFWVGGQQLGAKVTNSPCVRDIVLENTKAGCMPVAVVGNTRNWKVERVDVYGDATWGIDVEWGWQGTEFNKTAGVPENPDVNQTMDNGQLPYNGKVINFNGYDLQNCKGFLRTAGCYNVKFENCEGYNVHNFIYVYGGDRNPSRFTQNDRFKGCKLKINRQTFLKPTYGITVIFPNLDGTTKDPLPDWTNYDHTVVFDDCEIQGNYINDEIQSCAVRFYACTGAVVFNRCTFSNSFYGVRAERATSNGTYISSNALRFNNCIFKKNYQDVKLDAINGVIFNQSKFKSMLGKDNPSISIGVGYQSDLNKFIDCTWSGQNNRDDGVQEFIHIGNGAGNALIRCDFRMHKTTYKAIKYVGAGVLSGYDNTSNGQLVDTAYETNKIRGQASTSTKATIGISNDTLDFNKGETFIVNSAFILARCINGQSGDKLTFRSVSSVPCTIQHNKVQAGTGRFVNKSNSDHVENNDSWSRSYVNISGDWYEV